MGRFKKTSAKRLKMLSDKTRPRFTPGLEFFLRGKPLLDLKSEVALETQVVNFYNERPLLKASRHVLAKTMAAVAAQPRAKKTQRARVTTRAYKRRAAKVAK